MIRRVMNWLQSDVRVEKSKPVRDFSLESGERQTAAKLSGIRHDHVVRYRFVERMLLHRKPAGASWYGLDAFCGNGYGTYLLSQSIGCPILGIDASNEALEMAEMHYSSALTMYVRKIYPFELPRSRFDFVVSLESLEHVSQDESLFRSFVDALTPAGFLFVSVPNQVLQPFHPDLHKFHVKHYMHEEIVEKVWGVSHQLSLEGWYGQNVYRYENGHRTGLLGVDDMGVMERIPGQFLMYLFRKNRFVS